MPMENQTQEFTISANAFKYNDGNSAIRQVLAGVDQNGDHIITSAEASAVTIKIIGYSWGGPSALGLSQKLSQTGYLRVGGTPNQPVQYRLDSTIPIHTLVVIDSIAILNWPTDSLPSNVQNLHNYYQTLGKNSQFIAAAYPRCAAGIDAYGCNWGDFGYAVTRKFKGSTVSGAPTGSEINVTTDCTDCYTPWVIHSLNDLPVRLYGPKVNHTTIPLYVSPVVVPLMQ